MIKIIKSLESQVKSLHCLDIPDIKAFFIVKIDASDIGYGMILKQKFKIINRLFGTILVYGRVLK
jgi:hypothetical protein